jgi:hypothetical protein
LGVGWRKAENSQSDVFLRHVPSGILHDSEHLLRVWSTGFSRRKPSQPKRLRCPSDVSPVFRRG